VVVSLSKDTIFSFMGTSLVPFVLFMGLFLPPLTEACEHQGRAMAEHPGIVLAGTPPESRAGRSSATRKAIVPEQPASVKD
jgi:hypothetical protein